VTRKRLIGYSAIGLMVGLSLVERATNSVDLVPANVVSVTSMPANKGPGEWRVTFQLSSRDTYETEPLTREPHLGLGDPICLRMHERSWAKTKFTLTSETSCWDDAVTPLNRPD
jgi:hypothetical protein